MKTRLVLLAVSAAAFYAFVLFVNKAQETCVTIGQLAPGELTKITFSLAKPDPTNLKESMVELHATVGTLLVISLLMFILALVAGLIKTKTSNKASHATAEPEPGAASSARER